MADAARAARPGLHQHLFPAEPADAAALLQARPGDPRAVERYPGDVAGRHCRLGRAVSHFVVDEELDRGFIDCWRARTPTRSQALPREKLNSGSSEIRIWICVAGAVEHLALDWSLYVPGYRTPAGSGTGLGFAFWA